MRILAVNYEYTLTGSALLLLRLAEHLREAGHEVSVCAAIPGNGPIREAYRERGFVVLDARGTASIDVAICNTVMTAPQLLELSGSARTIWWIHEEKLGLLHLLQNPSQIAAFERASAVVFPVAYLRDAVYRSFLYNQDPNRIAIIPAGIPPIDIEPAPRPDDRTFRLVSVGSVYPRKRHADLIRAVALYSGPAKCIIAGKYHTLPEDCLQLVAAAPDRYELVGEVDR